MHRPDRLTDPDEPADACGVLRQQGKVLAFRGA